MIRDLLIGAAGGTLIELCSLRFHRRQVRRLTTESELWQKRFLAACREAEEWKIRADEMGDLVDAYSDQIEKMATE